MASYKEGCVVLYRSTELRYTVVRWDQEAELLLLTPAAFPSINSNNSTVAAADNNDVHAGERGRTRWTFEHMVDLVEENAPKTPSKSQNRGGSAKGDTTAAAAAARTKHTHKASSGGAPVLIPTTVNFDPTPHARRAAQLDSRVEIRRHPKRGRGLFALRDMPAGAEVMRVPAAAAVLLGRERERCGGCLLSMNAVGPLEACHGCSLGFCAGCKNYATCGGKKVGDGGGGGVVVHSSATCELTKELVGVCATTPKGGPPDEGILRLLADVLIRRKAGMINDEEWDVLNSLESHDNKDRTMSLAPRELQKCARLFKDLVDIDVSDEDIQTMYRRITRNVHTVCPNTTKPGFGSVQGLFACGALVNHSCLPNTVFHCVAESSSVDGPPVIKQVLRTIRNIRAGDELCYSYLSSGAAACSVLERRGCLESWGFQCACKRCHSEAEEDRRLQMHPTPVDKRALKLLAHLVQIRYLGLRENAPALKEEAVMPCLQEMMTFFLREKGGGLSPVLQTRIAVVLMEVTELVDATNDAFRFGVYGFVADELSEIGDPLAIRFFTKQYMHSKAGNCDDLSAIQLQGVEIVRKAGIGALRKAAQLCGLLYGEGHKESIRFREIVEAAVRKSAGGV